MIQWLFICISIFNENESKNIFELFIQKESNYTILINKLVTNYKNISNLSDFMNQFTNIKVPLNDSTIYYLDISNSDQSIVQVFYYFGN